MAEIVKRFLFVLAAISLTAGTICTSAVGEDTSKGSVTWGISWIGDGPGGALILDTVPDGPAAAAGLVPGDVISSVDGRQVKTSAELKERIRSSRPYTTVSIVVQRFGARLETALLPTGVLRLEVKNFDRSFSIPGVPKTAFTAPSTALDALEQINVLKNVVIDHKTGQIEVMGIYDPNYSTGPIPYLDLLKTALKYPEPALNLDFANRQWEPRPHSRRFSLASVVLGMPAAERERQSFIRGISAAYGITPEEYVEIFNYANGNTRTEAAPAHIGRILIKTFRYVGRDEVAEAYRQLAGNTSDDYERALKSLGKGSAAQEVLADKTNDSQQTKDKLLSFASIAIMERLGMPEGKQVELISKTRTGELQSAEILDMMYKFFPVSIKDKSGRPLFFDVMTKIPIGDVPGRTILGETNPLPFSYAIETIDLDRGSRLARIMYEADYVIKGFTQRPDLFGDVSGLKTRLEYLRSKEEESGHRIYHLAGRFEYRYWFEPKRVELEIKSAPAGDVLSFGRSEMEFKSAVDQETVNSLARERFKELKLWDAFLNYEQGWSAQVNDNFDLYARGLPALHSLREAAKVMALAKWLREKKIAVSLSDVKQERWELPKTVPTSRGIVFSLTEPEPGKFVLGGGTFGIGGVTFKRSNWTSYGPASKVTEARVPDQLVLSSQLGQKAAQAASKGDLESARYLAELSAQALTGRVSRGDLTKMDITMPKARSAEVSPVNVRLQRELLKQTSKQISALTRDRSNAQISEHLGQINRVYDQIQSKPALASDYLHQLQTRQTMVRPEPVGPSSSRPLPLPPELYWGKVFGNDTTPPQGIVITQDVFDELNATRRSLGNDIINFIEEDLQNLAAKIGLDFTFMSEIMKLEIVHEAKMIPKALSMFQEMKEDVSGRIVIYADWRDAAWVCLATPGRDCRDLLSEGAALERSYVLATQDWTKHYIVGKEVGATKEWARELSGINAEKQGIRDYLSNLPYTLFRRNDSDVRWVK